MSENDNKAVPGLLERSGEYKGDGDSPYPNNVTCGLDDSIDKCVAKLANASDERFGVIFEALGEGVVLQNPHGEIILCNDSSAKILGLTVDQLEGRTSQDPRWYALKEDGSPFPGHEHPAMVALKTGKAQKDVLMHISKPDGTRSLIKINSVPIFEGGAAEPTSVVTSFTDVTGIHQENVYLKGQLRQLIDSQAGIEEKRKRLEEANQLLRDEADSDPLTKLKNRRGFFERLSSEVALASRNQLPLSLLIVDIDRLNEIHEKLGCDAGDDLLLLITKALQETSRLSDFIARYRSEEFAIILPCTTLTQAHHLAERLAEALQGIEGNTPVSACIGLAEYRMGSLLNDLVEEAEEELMRAKAMGLSKCLPIEF